MTSTESTAAPIVFSVTAEDIAKGIRGSFCYCPIARAIARRLGRDADSERVQLTEHSLFLVRFAGEHLGWSTKEFPLPVSAIEFIHRFDSGKDVAPFTFTIEGLTSEEES